MSCDYYRSTAFKDDVAEYTQGIYSRGRKVKLQNQLAKQLAESKYSGAVANRKAKPMSEIEQDFKQNLQTQYGFDQKTAATMWKLYHNIKKKEGANADYVFNRLMGGIVYNDEAAKLKEFSIEGILAYLKERYQWNGTAGAGSHSGMNGFKKIEDQIKDYGISKNEYRYLSDSIMRQHTQTNSRADFAHQSITTATLLYNHYDRFANIVGLSKGKGFESHEYSNELSGWRGDATLGDPPSFNTPDYKSDLDAVNIVNRMKKTEDNYAISSNKYYSDLAQSKTSRSSEFLDNVGGIDYIKSELFKEAGITNSDNREALQELKNKNQAAYDFINSLENNSDTYIEGAEKE